MAKSAVVVADAGITLRFYPFALVSIDSKTYRMGSFHLGIFRSVFEHYQTIRNLYDAVTIFLFDYTCVPRAEATTSLTMPMAPHNP